MKISYTLFLTAMVAITMERCRTEYLLVAVDDDDFRKPTNDDVEKDDDVVREPKNDDVGKDDDVVREPNNDDEIRQQEIEALNRDNICDWKPCCCDSCYPCDYEVVAKERKIAEAKCLSKEKLSSQSFKSCVIQLMDPGYCINRCGGICPACKSAPIPKEDPEGSDDKDGPIISHGSPTGFTIPDEIPKQEGALPTNDDQSAYDCCTAAGVHILCIGLCLKDLDELPRARSLWEIPSVCSNHETAIKKCRQPDVPKMKETAMDKDGMLRSKFCSNDRDCGFGRICDNGGCVLAPNKAETPKEAPAPKTKAGKPGVKGKASLPIAKSQSIEMCGMGPPCNDFTICCPNGMCQTSC